MHEMSIAQSLLTLVEQELQQRPGSRCTVIRVAHGTLANLVPEAFELAVEALTIGGPMQGVRLELRLVPLRIKCRSCGHEFEPEQKRLGPPLYPCPQCDEELGHTLVQGKELYLESLEIETD
ncbi:putative hydrogenase nickel incorporation protein hypA [Megalodesulfovibrio gigas DSM 1382 = ATCC 19364]|uniref:Hydrogenase maturation factor HypA n=2 Tax=Megalodesulfovibrio gigas TaxID=879 RepID=T2GCT8_MEGG1|nr:putative hydrogenase nickel incorporation protein hypA [Megalodesulfovibrio gigas DSM 1382 = ATCC 19364]